jgi:hypothetical protein
MSDNGTPSPIASVVIQELREAARRGASVRELVAVIHRRTGSSDKTPIPVLTGFLHAFRVPLPKILPIREWLGTNNDQEIDALILPEIEKTRPQWAAEELSTSATG